MSLNANGRIAVLTSGKAGITHVSGQTDLAGTAVAGARQAVAWGAAGGSGVSTNTGALAIPCAAGETVVGIGFHDALAAGLFLGFQPYGSAGQVLDGVATVTTGDVFTSNAHGLATDDRVYFVPVADESLPAGLSATTLYYIRATGLTADTFTVATTSGGAAVDVTAAGEVAWFKTVPNTFASAGNLNVAIGQASLSMTWL